MVIITFNGNLLIGFRCLAEYIIRLWNLQQSCEEGAGQTHEHTICTKPCRGRSPLRPEVTSKTTILTDFMP